MVEKPEFSLRPLPVESSENAFRIYFTSNDLASLSLKPGQLCRLKNTDGISGTGIVWRSIDGGTNKGIIKISHFLKDAYGFKFQQIVSVEPTGQWQEAEKVTVRESLNSASGHIPSGRSEFELLSRYTLYRLPAIHPGMTFDVSPRGNQKRHFIIETISPARQKEDDISLYCLSGNATVEFVQGADRRPAEETPSNALELPETAVPGLSHQIRNLNEILSLFDNGIDMSFGLQPTKLGILLHGPHGCGKSLLLDKLTEFPWRKVMRINGAVSKAAISNAFKEALHNQPSLIVLDNLHTYAGAQDYGNSSQSSAASILAQEMDCLGDTKVLVVGATLRLDEIDAELRVSHRFSTEIELPVPNVQTRKDILKGLGIAVIDPSLLDKVGEETHGYVASDLRALVLRATISARRRNILRDKASESSLQKHVDPELLVHQNPFRGELLLAAEDFKEAKRLVKPSAMREIYVQTPNVKWSDVGGQEEVKEQLRRATEWPVTRAEDMVHFEVEPPKGLLLYGPPGCSKTLIAKALAGERKLNFLAVKGAELISMYVGSSERAIRDIFQKARAASPSILFFDEIDAIAAKRDISGHKSGLNVLTTLLNEMDGIEDFTGVFVLAATNMPELLDEALMRPGRLDTSLYIGPPDQAARKQIFEIKTRKKPLDKEVDLEPLAKITEGHSGAEVAMICNLAAQFALAECDKNSGGSRLIYQSHFEEAVRRVPRQITPQMKERYEKWASIGR